MTLQNKSFGIPDHIMRRPANVARVGFKHVFAHATIENWLVLKKWHPESIGTNSLLDLCRCSVASIKEAIMSRILQTLDVGCAKYEFKYLPVGRTEGT